MRYHTFRSSAPNAPPLIAKKLPSTSQPTMNKPGIVGRSGLAPRPGWQDEVRATTFDQAIHTVPPFWTKKGKDIAAASRRAVPAEERFRLLLDTARQLADAPDGAAVKIEVI